MNLQKQFFHLLFYIFAFLSSCGNEESNPTHGKQKLCIDESYTQLFDAQIDAFESIYKYSDIEVLYKSEDEVMQDFKNDSVRVIVIGRDLTENEKKYFNNKKSFPVSTKIAFDAVGFITHKENQISNLTFEQLLKIFKGEITTWNILDSSAKQKEEKNITIVFDNKKSGNVRYIKNTLLHGGLFPQNCYAVKTNPDVIDYVSQNKNALGIISVNWISDKEDTLTRSFLKKVNVLGISSIKNTKEFFQPYQAYIANKQYPLCREVYIINREGRTGLGTGFVAFVAGEKGQLIILKAGMVPATMPVRIVNVTNN
ncbi:MAG: substrate-binding domain-containing protein [Bacteroidota bacterium]